MSFLVFIILIAFTSTLALATQTTDFFGDSVSDFTLTHNPDHIHMGTKSTTYRYGSSADQTKYQADISGAKSEWGSYVSMSYNASGAGIIKTHGVVDNDHLAWGGPSSYNSSLHATAWAVSFTTLFDSQTDQYYRARIATHEIGHVYGLDHSDSNTVMYAYVGPSGTVIGDLNGMSVCTHDHLDTEHASWTYSSFTTGQHKKRCGICKGYYIQNHTWPANWYSYNSSSHRRDCTLCGVYTSASHTYPSAWSPTSITSHLKKCTASGCNYMIYGSHTWQVVGSYNVCTLCGYRAYLGARAK